jgi:DNA-binding transcriptional ArsR family regulator
MKFTEAVNIHLALGQETRHHILSLIVQHEDGISPKKIHERLDIPPPTLSFHLKELLQAELICVQRKSRNLIYRPQAHVINELISFLVDNYTTLKKENNSIKPRIKYKNRYHET